MFFLLLQSFGLFLGILTILVYLWKFWGIITLIWALCIYISWRTNPDRVNRSRMLFPAILLYLFVSLTLFGAFRAFMNTNMKIGG